MNGKILMFGLDENQIRFLKNISAALKIKAVSIDTAMYGCTLSELAQGKGREESSSGTAVYETMIVFCQVSDKHMDRILSQLKAGKIPIKYKAVMTPTNSRWTVRKLYFELERERMAIEG